LVNAIDLVLSQEPLLRDAPAGKPRLIAENMPPRQELCISKPTIAMCGIMTPHAKRSHS
jgi:hypothetical protein